MEAGKLDELGGLYSADIFYSWQIGVSYRSAVPYCEHLFRIYQPASVADFGCGRGAWLKAMHEQGAERLFGVDGPWNSQEAMIDQSIEFCGADLNEPGPAFAGQTFDLAMTLEVVEHLEPKSSERVADALASLAPVLMFGAAFSHQTGQNHINERYHSFWAGLLRDRGFEVYDYFRPTFWGDDRVAYYYQQNTFLYVRKGHALGAKLREAGYRPIENLAFLDCVHPDMLERYVGLTIRKRLRAQLVEVAPEPVLAVARFIRNSLGGKAPG